MSDLKTEELVAKMKELAKIADELPEKYCEKTFEVLLKDFLWGLRETERTVSKTEGPELAVKAVAPQKFIIPISVRALLQQYEIPEETIQRLFVIDGEQIQPKY